MRYPMHTVSIFLVFLMLKNCLGQRAIVSLASKVQKKIFSKKGEDESDEDGFDAFENTSPGLLWTVLVGFVLYLVMMLWFRKGTEREADQDGEFVVHKDHVVSVNERVDVDFSSISLSLTQKKGEPRMLLDNVSGSAKPGRLLAIMGPSGAGKSTLLHALSGKIKFSSRLALQGSRAINGQRVAGHSLLPSSTLIEQSATFFPHMTVRETLRFRVDLKLGSRLSPSAREKMVNDIIEEVGLSKSADTIVGDNKVRGISGGERKRLSIAVELISSPSVIMLDEPTSGLDATAATSMMTTLRSMADKGKTIIAVIHQPSHHVFAMFDDLLLMSEGKLMYMGEVSKVRSHMNQFGCPADAEVGTAEHVLDCISRVKVSPGETQEEIDRRLERLVENAHASLPRKASETSSSDEVAVSATGGPQASMVRQFGALLRRSLKEVFRGKKTLLIKLVQQLTIGLIYGGIYSLGTDQASIQDRFGLLSLIAIGSANSAVAQTIRSFPKEKAIVANEIASRMYRTFPYFVGKALSELPLIAVFNGIFGGIVYHLTGLSDAPGKFLRFLTVLTTHGMASEAVGLLIGAVSPNSDVALALFPALLVINIIFDGKNISEESTPRLLKWIPKVGLIRWGYEGLCVNEFEGLEFDTSGPRRGPVAKVGADALARFGLGSRSLPQVIQAQLWITVVSWSLSFLGLTLTGQKWQTMKNVSDKN